MAKTQIKIGEKSLYDTVLDDIGSGKIIGGDRLKVQDLAERYGTSSNPVREVLRQLQGEGIVDILPNRGAVVRKVDADTLRDIFEILSLLEPYFITWFAEIAQPEQIAEMERIQDAIEALQIGDKRGFEDLDSQFHSVINDSHYNRRAVETWRNLRKSLQVFVSKIPISPSRFASIKSEHHNLIESCRENDVEAALTACRHHIQGAGEQMYRQLRARADR
jgi:DNA-binding GntR family transcriptional regulator